MHFVMVRLTQQLLSTSLKLTAREAYRVCQYQQQWVASYWRYGGGKIWANCAQILIYTLKQNMYYKN